MGVGCRSVFAPIAIDLDLRVQLPGEAAELRAAFEHARIIASYDGSRPLDDAPPRRLTRPLSCCRPV